MLTATLAYKPETNTVAVFDTAVPGPLYAAYRLLDRRPGVADLSLPATTTGGVATWLPPTDDCYPLVLQGGAVTGGVFVAADESPALYHLQVAGHLEAKADNFDKLARRSPAGHPLGAVSYLEARRREARYALAESNPGEASLLLTQTIFPS